MIKSFVAGDFNIEVYNIKKGNVIMQIACGPMPYSVQPGASAIIRVQERSMIELIRAACDAWELVSDEIKRAAGIPQDCTYDEPGERLQ